MSDERQHSVEAERRIAATPERIWQALADPERLAGWFVDGARREGDRYFWRWEDFGTFDVRIVAEEPGELLVMEGPGASGAPHRTEVRIRTGDGYSVVHIVESGFFGPPEEDDEARGVRSGWAQALALLELYVTDHWEERRHAFFTLRPATVDWDTLLPWFTEPHLLEQWLAEADGPLRTGGRADLRLLAGPALSGRVLCVTDTEVSLTWEEGDGALELKAFAGPDDQRFVALRGTHWGAERNFRGLEDAAEAALDRLAGLLAWSPITGFMIVRDGVRLGYPFLEAIMGSLALCQRVEVLDGDSTDDTWHWLERLREAVGSARLRLHREAWRAPGRRGHILAAATNQLREQLDAEPESWLWNFQANEILSPESAGEIRLLLRQHHNLVCFRLPFTTLMGFHYRAYTDFRGRLFRNIPALKSIGDAYDCGFDLDECRRRPWRIPLALEMRRKGAAGYLDHPVLRLRAPFPENYSAKLRNRAVLNPWDDGAPREAEQAAATLESVRRAGGDIRAFWEAIPFARQHDAVATGPIPPERRVAELPRVLQHLPACWRYDPARSLDHLLRLPVPVAA